jgi:hypothetical protein
LELRWLTVTPKPCWVSLRVAAAPVAHADDFSTILADVTATEAAAATAFATASTDLADGNTPAGLTQLFIGLDDDLLGVPNELQVGSIDLLQGVPVIPASDFEFSFAAPGVALATTIAGLPATDYADTALDNTLSKLTSGFCRIRSSSSASWPTCSSVVSH